MPPPLPPTQHNTPYTGSQHSLYGVVPVAEPHPLSSSLPGSTNDGQNSGSSGKRRRIALACGTCRTRKSRCDGARPKCSMCRELGSDCVYQQVGSSPNLTVGKEYVAQLEHRIEQIEEFIRPYREGRADLTATTTLKPYPLNEETSSYSRHGSASTEQSSPEKLPSHGVNPNETEIGELDNSEDFTDGMAAISFQDEQDSGFFGPSSNIAFMRHISQAITHATQRNSISINDRRGNIMMSMSISKPQAPTETTSQKTQNSRVNMYALPSEDQSWELIEEYFAKTGQLLPFIHEQSFCETYFQMKRSNFTKVRRTWLGLLNIVFAIAMSLYTNGNIPAQQRIEQSDVFYQRANALCDRESRRNTSLEMVQYLLILGQYLQTTQKSVQALTNHGLAITVAFQLGIHSPEANKAFPPLECEIRKRTWFGCVLLDRTLSMTFGRPCIIPESYVKLDMPFHGIQMVGRIPQPEIQAHQDGCFFNAAIQLYVSMYNVLNTCYGQNLGLDSSQTTRDISSMVYEGDFQMKQFQHKLVPSLGLHIYQKPLTVADIDIMKADSVIFQRFNIVLSLRFHNLRILLHRKFLEQFLDMETSTTTTTAHSDIISSPEKEQQQVVINSISNCVESAIIIISIVHTIATTTGWHRALLGAWNYSLYYTFNAGLVIFGALLVSSRESPKNPAAWDTVERSRPYLDVAIDALRSLDSGNRVVERCVEYLLALTALGLVPGSTTVPQQQQQQQSHSHLQQQHIQQQSGNMVNSFIDHGAQFAFSHSPDGIDLGEFMIDSDLDFIGRLFYDTSQNSGHMNNSTSTPVTYGG